MNAHIPRLTIVAAAAAMLVCLATPAAAESARDRYLALVERQHTVLELIAGTPPDAPAAGRDAAIKQGRSVIAGYDALVRKYHGSGYSDNALWNAAAIADALYARFERGSDRVLALRYYMRLAVEYPSSSLVKGVEAKRAALEKPAAVLETPKPAAASAANATRSGVALLTGIERTVLPEGIRITLSLDREVPYREEKLSGPARVFFDLKDVQTTPELKDVVLRYTNEAVRQIRVGRHPGNTVRVVLDMEGIAKHSVFALYNPFRLVIDAEPAFARSEPSASFGAAGSASARTETPASFGATSLPPARVEMPPNPGVATPLPSRAEPPAKVSVASPASARAKPSTSFGATSLPPARVEPGPSSEVAGTVSARSDLATTSPVVTPIDTTPPNPPPAPVAPRSNSAGGFSLSRQLGLGVTRVVIDPGHGGHDPGAQGKGINEADLTLDVALRVEKLLQSEGLDVVLTRRSNVYIPLEERTAMANRESADLFLSIHANASRNVAAQGVETYFLSFASSADAEAVAARENSASSGGMHNLPDIIKAIALNNKLDESRDFAGMVQEALVTRLRRSNRNLRNLGVKKAPFVVLIGAGMPSVLAEISFLTNKQDLQLLKTNAYKQRIAEALQAAVMRYRRSLKGQGQVAVQ